MPLHRSSGRWQLGLALSLITTVLWGLLPIALTVTLQALNAYTVTWFRFLVAFGLLAIYLASRRQFPNFQKLRTTPLGLLAIATLGLATNYLLFLEGLARTSPASAEVLIQLATVLLGLGALLIFKERYTLLQFAGLGVLSLGFILFFHEQLRMLLAAPTQYLLGSSLLVLSSVAWAIYALAQKQLLQSLPSSVVMMVIYGASILIFSPMASPSQILTLDALHLGMLLFCALNTLAAYGAFAEALNHWEASRISAVVALTPLMTIAFMWGLSVFRPGLVTPERLTVGGLVGAALVVFGSLAIALGQARSHQT